MEIDQIQHRLVLSCAILAVLYFSGPVLIPFILGVFIAWMLMPIMHWVQRRRINRQLSALFLTLMFCACIGTAITFLMPIIISMVQSSIEALPSLMPRVVAVIENATGMAVMEPVEQVVEDVSEGDLSTLVEPATKATPILFSMIGSGLNFLLLCLITPLSIYYLLADWTVLRRGVRRMLPDDTYEELQSIWDVSKERGLRYIQGRAIVMICIAIFHVIGLLAVGLNNAIVVGLLAGVSILVPVLGNLTVLALAVIAALLQFDTFTPVIVVIGIFGLGQVLEMAVIEPYFLGDTMDMHPFVVLLVLMLGAHFAGILGAIVALPVTAIFIALMDEYRENSAENNTVSKDA